MTSEDSSAVVKRSTSDLMAPPPPPKRIKRPATVLEEDDYTSAISHIIARDFFPGLVETEAQQEFLDALASQDKQWIASAGRKLAQLQTPGPDGRRERGRRGTSLASESPVEGIKRTASDTPLGWTGATPAPSVAGSSETGQIAGGAKQADRNMSLSAFQARYNSEDNESFNKLLDNQNEKRVQKYSWLWNKNKVPSNRQIVWHQREQMVEAAKAEQEQEDGRPQLAIEGPDKRKAMPDAWKHRPDNNLMFGPRSVEDDLQTVQQRAEQESRAGPKAILFDNTRMPPPPSELPLVPESPSLSAVNDALAGRPRLDASEMGDYSGGDTPRVNGYAFVDSEEPEPEPESEPQRDWSTLFLGPGDATPNPFTIRQSSKREALHHRMVEKVAKSKRTGSLVSQLNTPTPKHLGSPRPGRGELTPAAQRLLGRVGGRTPGGSIWEGAGAPKAKSTLGAAWTPKQKSQKEE